MRMVLPFLLAFSVLFGPADGAAPTLNLPPDQALQALKQGNQRFVSGKGLSCVNAGFSVQELSAGQAPNAIVLSCSDSRVPPEQIFDQELGQIFVIRVAGNVLNAENLASMEYAIEHLGSRLIVILGHESCGAVKSALDIPPTETAGSPSLDRLLAEIRANLGAFSAPSDPKLRSAVQTNVSAVAGELIQRSKVIAGAVSSGQVQIAQGIYDIDTGHVDFWSSSFQG